MTKTITAAKAISESQKTDSTIIIAGSDVVHADLLDVCDGYTEHYVDDGYYGYTLTEYWSRDGEDGGNWRVHVRDNG